MIEVKCIAIDGTRDTGLIAGAHAIESDGTQACKNTWALPNATGIFKHHDVAHMMVLILNRPMATNCALKLLRG